MSKRKFEIEEDDLESQLYEFEVDIDDIDNFVVEIADDADIETRYTNPKLHLRRGNFVKYDNAEDLARDCEVKEGERIDAIVSGNFIFGDYICAYLQEYDLCAEELTINTLSLSQENIDVLAELMEAGFIKQLNLIVSAYFYSHHHKSLMPYIYEKLDSDKNNVQVAVCGTHMKCTTFKTSEGLKYCMHGSANLRSSANIEQFTMEENKELYDFYDTTHKLILDEYATINTAIRNNKLRDTIGIQPHKTKGGKK